GFLDVLSRSRCAGWLLSPDTQETGFEIEVWRDGEVVGTGRCVLPRPDLRDQYPIGWRAGFSVITSKGAIRFQRETLHTHVWRPKSGYTPEVCWWRQIRK